MLWVLVIQVAGLIDRCTECLSAHTLCSESAIAREATVFILTMRYMRFPHTNVQRYRLHSYVCWSLKKGWLHLYVCRDMKRGLLHLYVYWCLKKAWVHSCVYRCMRKGWLHFHVWIWRKDGQICLCADVWRKVVGLFCNLMYRRKSTTVHVYFLNCALRKWRFLRKWRSTTPQIDTWCLLHESLQQNSCSLNENWQIVFITLQCRIAANFGVVDNCSLAGTHAADPRPWWSSTSLA